MSALATARLIVVKIGSALIAQGGEGGANHAWLSAFAGDLARLRGRGQRVVVVSSGAVALGRRRLGLRTGALTLAESQASAAAGQSSLMRAWEEALEPAGLTTAQVLLTPDDTEVRRRFLNARATLETLLDVGAIAVVNENDTVATQELRYGDNDRLAARVAQMVGADLLVLLSDVDGLYSGDPRADPSAELVPVVAEITDEIEAMASGANAGLGLGRGGMATKLAAARIAAAAGCATLITRGETMAPLSAIEAGARFTIFEASTTPAAAYKSWIGGALKFRKQGLRCGHLHHGRRNAPIRVDARLTERTREIARGPKRAPFCQFLPADQVPIRVAENLQPISQRTKLSAAAQPKVAFNRSGDRQIVTQPQPLPDAAPAQDRRSQTIRHSLQKTDYLDEVALANGIRTDGDVQLPEFDGGIVKGQDLLEFEPFDQHSRRLNLSRFRPFPRGA